MKFEGFEEWKADSKQKAEREKRKRLPEEQIKKEITQFVENIKKTKADYEQKYFLRYLQGVTQNSTTPEFEEEKRESPENQKIFSEISGTIEALRKKLHITYGELREKLLEQLR